MGKDSTKGKKRSIVQYDMLEESIRMKAQEFIQEVFEEEVNEFLGRDKSERIKPGIDIAQGYRNGYGKPRRLALMNGTVTIRRPRVRNTEERFESMVLPYFKRRTKELGELLPEPSSVYFLPTYHIVLLTSSSLSYYPFPWWCLLPFVNFAVNI